MSRLGNGVVEVRKPPHICGAKARHGGAGEKPRVVLREGMNTLWRDQADVERRMHASKRCHLVALV